MNSVEWWRQRAKMRLYEYIRDEAEPCRESYGEWIFKMQTLDKAVNDIQQSLEVIASNVSEVGPEEVNDRLNMIKTLLGVLAMRHNEGELYKESDTDEDHTIGALSETALGMGLEIEG